MVFDKCLCDADRAPSVLGELVEPKDVVGIRGWMAWWWETEQLVEAFCPFGLDLGLVLGVVDVAAGPVLEIVGVPATVEYAVVGLETPEFSERVLAPVYVSVV